MKKVILTNGDILEFQTRTPDELNDVLRVKLLGGIVHFSFQKKDGTTREAFGTLAQDRITIPAGESKPNDAVATYFDIEANAWRSYTIANLIAIY